MGIFTVIHVLFSKTNSVTEKVFILKILLGNWAIKITNFINEDLYFLRNKIRRFPRFDMFSTSTNFIKKIFRFMTL